MARVTDATATGTVARLADRLVAQLISVDPLLATGWGVPSDDLPELSPSWWEERRGLFAAVAAALRARPPADVERVAASMLLERAETEVEWVDSGEAYGELQAALDSPVFRLRYAFEEMPKESDSDWERILRRLEQVPAALAGWHASLEVSRRSGPRAAARQVQATADALERWAGDGVTAAAFISLVSQREPGGDALARELDASAITASLSLGELAAYLRGTYLQSADERDGVGSHRFALWSRRYSGAVIGENDYEWAAAALQDANRDQAAFREEVAAGGPALVIAGVAEQMNWAEQQIAKAISASERMGVLDLHEFPGIRVRLAPEGSTYYSPPSEDGSREATVWFPAQAGASEVEFSMTVLFHESVPGHHVEASLQRRNSSLNRFARLVYIPGHSEGWALYAERLAEEIGLLDTPRARLGCRGSQALRLASLLIDVGIHCGLEPPTAVRSVVGESWTVDGTTALVAQQGLDQTTAARWVTDMLGRPGHRASYAAGERAWLSARAAASAQGEPLGEFHARVLGLGPLGLDQLAAAAAR